jgi:hypothetical protein
MAWIVWIHRQTGINKSHVQVNGAVVLHSLQ